MTNRPISERIRAAVELLAPKPDERLLEVGCGTGQAIAAILQAQPTVRIAAIDRSGTAVARATALNRYAVADGRAAIATGDIEEGPPAGRFDRVFCIRVNSFWTKPGRALPNVARVLLPGGCLVAIYDAAEAKIAGPLLASLGAADWHTEEIARPGAWAIVARQDRNGLG